MVEWLSFGRISGWFASKGWGRVKRRALDKQQLVDDTAGVASKVKELIRRASPMEASIERVPGETAAKMKSWQEDWRVLRPKLITAVDRHPSAQVRKLGNDLAEDVEKLFLALRYLASTFTGVAESAAANQSANERHAHALKLADDLLQRIHAY